MEIAPRKKFIEVSRNNIKLIKEHLDTLDSSLAQLDGDTFSDAKKWMDFANTLAAIEYLFRHTFPKLQQEVTCS